MMYHTLLSRLSALLIFALLMTACGGAAEPPPAANDAPAAAPTAGTAAEPQATTEAAAAAATPEAAAAATPEAAAPAGDVVQVHAYINTGGLNRKPEGSDPTKLAEMNAIISKETGVEIVPILPPGGAAALEKLNLLLSSPSDQLDLFQGDWTQYKEAAIPLNDLLEKHGQHVCVVPGES